MSSPQYVSSTNAIGFAPETSLERETADGWVRGATVADGRVNVWRGLPYAAPPVGAMRFAAPAPVVPWAGVRDATVDGRSAVQAPSRRPGPLRVWLGARRGRSEDCLYLNVWAPAAASQTPRPVVVWVHGGSFKSGSGSFYDAARLVDDGDVVVVTVNYRLGVLGFVDFHDAIGGDERIVSNPGLRDQLAALHWVRDNVSAFGGDPERVTVAGESAGSASVCALATAAEARGLVHGVIAQSGALTLTVDRDDAARNAGLILQELDLSRERIDQLWRLPASALLGAAIRCQDRRRGALLTRPWWDGDLLADRLEAGYRQLAPVPTLIGSNAHEHRTFTKMRADIMPMTRDALATSLTSSLGWEHARRVLAEYADDADGLNDLGSDLVFRMPSIHVADVQARQADAWMYRVDFGSWIPGAGAFHAIELMLLFPQPPRTEFLMLGPGSPEREALAARFRANWLHFVRHGRPSSQWPAYDPDGERATYVWDLEDRVERDPGAARRVAWAGRDVKIH
jgi:para-nitrobenzyl esterase